MLAEAGRPSQLGPGSPVRLLRAPPRDLAVVAGEEHRRDLPSPEVLWTRVVGVLGPAAERLGEGVLEVALVAAERAAELPRDGVHHGHGGDLAAREDVRPDRDRVVREMVVHALVEPLVAAAQEREAIERRELRHDLVPKLAADGRQHGDPALGEDALDRSGVDRLQGGAHDVHADHHPGPAAVGSVVHLPVAPRRVVAQIVHTEVKRAGFDRVSDRARLAHPVELARKERDDVELERHRKSSRIATVRSDTSTRTTTSSTKGMRSGSDASSARTSRTSLAGYARTRWITPRSREPARTAHPTRSTWKYSSPSVGGRASAGTVTSAPRMASAPSRSAARSSRTMGRSAVPLRATITAGRSATFTRIPGSSGTTPPWPSRCTEPSRPCGRPILPTTIRSGRQGVSAGDLDMHAAAGPDRRGPDDRPERAGHVALLADHLAHVVLGHVQLEHDVLPGVASLDAHRLRMVDELAREIREEVVHAPRLDPGDGQELADRLGRLRAAGEPLAGPVGVDLDERRLQLGVVPPDLLDRAAVARDARVG